MTKRIKKAIFAKIAVMNRGPGHLLLRLIFLSTATFLFISCGTDVVGPAAVNSNNTPTALAASPCGIILKARDTDGDGIDDFDELYGYQVNGVTVYTNPNNADTDGDGVSDGEEAGIKTLSNTTRLNLLNGLASPVTDPTKPDYLVRVFAAGGADSAATANAKTGWNSFSALNIPAAATVTFFETGLSTWSTVTPDTEVNSVGLPATYNGSNGSYLLGGNCDPTYATNNCIHGKPRSELIGKWAASGAATDPGIAAPFEIGSVMTGSPLEFVTTNTSANSQYLLLRANDRDRTNDSDTSATGLIDNSGSVIVDVQILSSNYTIYPQAPPTADISTFCN